TARSAPSGSPSGSPIGSTTSAPVPSPASGSDRPLVPERQAGEAPPPQPVGRGGGVQRVGEGLLGVVGLAVQAEAVEVVEVRVLVGALGDDAGQFLADDPQRQLPRRGLLGVAGGPEPQPALAQRTEVGGAGTRGGLVDGAEDG